jgi:threonine dehydrogenase-like Zn-dependent dehydrogenase
VTHEVPLAQIPRAFDLFSNYDERAIKIAIKP